MSDWKSVSGFITSAPLDLTFFGKSNRAMVRISPDGKVEYGPDYTPDAAAKAFWEAVNHHGPYAENTRLREENARLREEVERLKSEESCNDVLLEYAQAENQRLREENAQLREALKPFVDAGHFKVVTEVGTLEEHNQVSIHVKESDLRAAAAAIRETSK